MIAVITKREYPTPAWARAAAATADGWLVLAHASRRDDLVALAQPYDLVSVGPVPESRRQIRQLLHGALATEIEAADDAEASEMELREIIQTHRLRREAL